MHGISIVTAKHHHHGQVRGRERGCVASALSLPGITHHGQGCILAQRHMRLVQARPQHAQCLQWGGLSTEYRYIEELLPDGCNGVKGLEAKIQKLISCSPFRE